MGGEKVVTVLLILGLVYYSTDLKKMCPLVQ